MKYFDKAFDAVIYLLIILCYIAAGWVIIQNALSDGRLIDLVVLIAAGTGLSAYFVWIRSKTG